MLVEISEAATIAKLLWMDDTKIRIVLSPQRADPTFIQKRTRTWVISSAQISSIALSLFFTNNTPHARLLPRFYQCMCVITVVSKRQSNLFLNSFPLMRLKAASRTKRIQNHQTGGCSNKKQKAKKAITTTAPMVIYKNLNTTTTTIMNDGNPPSPIDNGDKKHMATKKRGSFMDELLHRSLSSMPSEPWCLLRYFIYRLSLFPLSSPNWLVLQSDLRPPVVDPAELAFLSSTDAVWAL